MALLHAITYRYRITEPCRVSAPTEIVLGGFDYKFVGCFPNPLETVFMYVFKDTCTGLYR